MRLLGIVALGLMVALASCAKDEEQGFSGDCAQQMAATKKERGEPEEIKTYDTSDGYHSHDWWYWSQGFERTFTWGAYVQGCETSDYTFSPIP